MPATPDDDKADDAALAAKVVAEQVRGLYTKAALPFLTVIVNSSILAYVLWDPRAAAPTSVWLVGIYAVTAARVVLLRAFGERSLQVDQARRWGWLFTVGSGLNGIVWGASALVLYPAGAVVLQAVILLVLGGMIAGAAASAATFFPAFLAFTAPAIVPITVRLLAEGDKVHLALGAMAALFGLAMSRIAWEGGRSLVTSARLRFRNAALVDDLRDTRTRLASSNADLERRVSERTIELLATLEQARQAEEALRRQKEFLQKIFDHSPIMLILYDADGKVELINREVERLLGWSLEEHRSLELGEHLFQDPVQLDLARKHFAAGASTWADFTITTKGGRQLFTSWANVRMSDGMVIGIGQDVTEQRKARDALVLSARMASVGTLAAGVAHEINNPLAFVLSNIEFTATALRAALAEVSSGAPGAATAGRLREAVDAIGDAAAGAERVRNVVRDLREVLETSIRMAQTELRHRARVVRRFEPVPPIRGHGDRLGQVFLNLLVNAAQSIPEGAAEKNEVTVVARTDGAGRAVVEIRDTGAGIPSDVLPRILDPFFTTKPVGQGTGLGLSICHGIVTGLGGEILVESAVGKGSVFRVILPATLGVPQRAVPSSIPPDPVRRARVLVVDDESMFGKAVERMLGDTHDVVFESKARKALDRISAGEVFDVILCDLMMPDVTGMDLVEELERTHPASAARVALTTGGEFTDRAREFLRRSRNRRISKPFAKLELDRLLASMLRDGR